MDQVGEWCQFIIMKDMLKLYDALICLCAYVQWLSFWWNFMKVEYSTFTTKA